MAEDSFAGGREAVIAFVRARAEQAGKKTRTAQVYEAVKAYTIPNARLPTGVTVLNVN